MLLNIKHILWLYCLCLAARGTGECQMVLLSLSLHLFTVQHISLCLTSQPVKMTYSQTLLRPLYHILSTAHKRRLTLSACLTAERQQPIESMDSSESITAGL